MTEKRFAVTQTVLGSGIYDFQAENELCESYDEDAYIEVCKKLNELHEENQALKQELQQYKNKDEKWRNECRKLHEDFEKDWKRWGRM